MVMALNKLFSLIFFRFVIKNNLSSLFIEQRTTVQGQVYFLHTQTGVSTWHDPRIPRYVLIVTKSGVCLAWVLVLVLVFFGGVGVVVLLLLSEIRLLSRNQCSSKLETIYVLICANLRFGTKT